MQARGLEQGRAPELARGLEQVLALARELGPGRGLAQEQGREREQVLARELGPEQVQALAPVRELGPEQERGQARLPRCWAVWLCSEPLCWWSRRRLRHRSPQQLRSGS